MISQDNTMEEDVGFSLAAPRDIPDREEQRCAKTWENGHLASFEGWNWEEKQPYFPVMKVGNNCKVPLEDGRVVYIALPTNPDWLKLFLSKVERFTPQQLSGRNGIFTWILYRKEGSQALQFAATQVRSVFEVGTLHKSIARAVNAYTVHGAGEMKKTGNKILYNFESGTYMLDWVRSKDRSCSLSEMGTFVGEKLKTFFPKLELVQSSGGTFITTPPTLEELNLYATAGFKVCIHNTADQCTKIKGTCENPLLGDNSRNVRRKLN